MEYIDDELMKEIESLMEESSDEQVDNIIILNDENGNPIEFEFLDLIEYMGNEYVVLLPVSNEEEDQVVILQVAESENTDEENYLSVDDEDVLAEVFDIFRDKFKDEFNFES